jgi:hypothetical protein
MTLEEAPSLTLPMQRAIIAGHLRALRVAAGRECTMGWLARSTGLTVPRISSIEMRWKSEPPTQDELLAIESALKRFAEASMKARLELAVLRQELGEDQP